MLQHLCLCEEGEAGIPPWEGEEAEQQPVHTEPGELGGLAPSLLTQPLSEEKTEKFARKQFTRPGGVDWSGFTNQS